MESISILIPVYRESNLLERLIQDLLKSHYKNKEIIIAVDEPIDKSMLLIKKYGRKIKFIVHKKRMGKVYSLNKMARISKGDILIFMDSDIMIKNPKNFLKTIAEKMKNADILDVKKDVFRDSFISKMGNYERIATNYINFLFAKIMKKCIGIEGTLIAVRRSSYKEVGGFKKTIPEDLDFGIRASIKDKKFVFSNESKIFINYPNSLKKLYKQRKRWYIGAGIWLKTYYKNLLSFAKQSPSIFLISFILLFPSLIGYLLGYMIFNFFTVQNIVSILLLVLSIKLSFLIAPLYVFTFGLSVIKNLIFILSNLIVFSVIYYLLSRKFRLKFNILEFIAYFILYNPILFLTLFAGIIIGIVNPKIKLKDWKI